MELFTYLMAKNGHNTSIHEDLFSYLLGKAQGGGGEIKTATGITINIPDAKKLVSFMMTKESAQETTTGKNLLNPSVVEGTKNGITYSFDSETQTYTFNGTCTSDNTLITSICQNVIEFTKDITTLSVHYVSGSATDGRVDFLNSSYAGINLNIDNISSSTPILSKTATFDYSSTVFNSRFRFDNGNTVNNLKIKLMVANTTDTSYEEYTGGIPSPNPDYPQEVKTVKGYSNLFDISTANYASKCSLNNNIYTTSTLTSGDRNVVIGYTPDTKYTILPNETYYISADIRLVSGTGTILNKLTFNTDISSSEVNNPNFTNQFKRYIFSATNNTTSNINTSRILFQFNGTGTNGGVFEIKNIMISKVNETYVPYGNNYIYTKVVGKNLFDKNAITNGYYYDASGNYTTSSITYISDYMEVESNSNYTFQTQSGGNRKRINYFDENKNWISQTYSDNSPHTFTTPNNIKYVRISFNTAVDSSNIQVEYGNEATIYEAYKETTTTIPLMGNELVGIGVYKDELKVDKSGHVFINKKTGKVILNENSNLTIASSDTFRIPTSISSSILKPTNQNNKIQIFSNYLLPITWAENWNGKIGFISGIESTNDLRIRVNVGMTLEELNTWLSTHNIELYYVLKTPELIDLQTTVDLSLFKGANTITNSEDGCMTIQYMSENEEA